MFPYRKLVEQQEEGWSDGDFDPRRGVSDYSVDDRRVDGHAGLDSVWLVGVDPRIRVGRGGVFFISSKPCHISGIRSNNNCESVLSPADGSDFPIEFALLSSELPVLYQGRFYGNHRPVGGSTLFASSTGASTNPFAVGCAHRLVRSLVCYLAVASGAWF